MLKALACIGAGSLLLIGTDVFIAAIELLDSRTEPWDVIPLRRVEHDLRSRGFPA
jgi:hypothetical protein